MPISPQESLEASQKTAVELAEPYFSKLDAYLSSPGPFPKIWDCKGLSNNVVSAIIAAYQKEGCRVERVSDWRDGDYVKFDAPVARGN